MRRALADSFSWCCSISAHMLALCSLCRFPAFVTGAMHTYWAQLPTPKGERCSRNQRKWFESCRARSPPSSADTAHLCLRVVGAGHTALAPEACAFCGRSGSFLTAEGYPGQGSPPLFLPGPGSSPRKCPCGTFAPSIS